MSTQLVSRFHQTLPLLSVADSLIPRSDSNTTTTETIPDLSTIPTCFAPDGYYCCPNLSVVACPNGYECDIPNKQCVKKANVALIAGVVVALVIVIGACIVGCIYYKKQKRAKAMAATGGRM
ncbi:hypothetical protein HDU97_004917 [Phlyctochytrium planicorne]|nr:hypothetical protein HDU97_004917 [Phlyctochytrium planicorne]